MPASAAGKRRLGARGRHFEFGVRALSLESSDVSSVVPISTVAKSE